MEKKKYGKIQSKTKCLNINEKNKTVQCVVAWLLLKLK